MQIKLNLITLLLAIVISQSLFVACLLWFSKNNRRSVRLLAILIVAIALWLTDHFMRIAGIYHQRPNLYFLPIFYSLGFGPLIWFYIRSLINKDFRFSARNLVHFIPLAVQACLYLVLSFTPYHTKQYYWEHVHQPYTYRLEFDGTWISMTIYLILSFRLLRKYQSWLADNFSELSNISLNWLKVILGILLVICIQWFIEIILRDGYGIYFNYDYSIEMLGIALLVLGIAGWKQSNLSLSFDTGTVPPSAKDVYVTDPLILQKIEEAMTIKKLFLNPTLSLVELSAVLALNAKTVSRHINAGFGKSFNEFVNYYRVEHVKSRLLSGDLAKFTLMGIASESGFNSKTTFNRIFREFTGLSPKEYGKD